MALTGVCGRPLVLVIRDGWGIGHRDLEHARRVGDATALATLPVLRGLLERYPWAQLESSGEAVGLPTGQMGNSEVGHQNLGAGRVIYQDFVRISRAISSGELFENPVLAKAIDAAQRKQAALHLVGLCSPGGVHSHLSHLYALLELARRRQMQRVFVHAITDGRDTPPSSAAEYLAELVAILGQVGVGQIATLGGRYYYMDRDKRWERTTRAYDAMCRGVGEATRSPLDAVRKSYRAGATDEFIEPKVVVDEAGRPIGRVEDGDAVVMFNFRPDRARQLTEAFTQPGFTRFQRQRVVTPDFVTMTEYDPRFGLPVAFPPESYDAVLGELLAERGLRQLRIAETEKYAHVTYFFNSGREAPFPGEDRFLIPSPKVATYDLQPEMSAPVLTEEVIHRIRSGIYDCIVLNFANADMVGHTGDLAATMRALEVVDGCIGRILEAVGQAGGTALITADHGNAERMIDDDGQPFTAHTTGPVHLILANEALRAKRLRNGAFADVAPTVLDLMGLPQPPQMTGRSLLVASG